MFAPHCTPTAEPNAYTSTTSLMSHYMKKGRVSDGAQVSSLGDKERNMEKGIGVAGGSKGRIWEVLT